MNGLRTEILLTLLIENIMARRTCIYYQGSEEPCLRGEHFLTCNCDGEVKTCEFLKFPGMKHWAMEEK